MEFEEVIHTDLEGQFMADVMGMKSCKIYMGEASRDKKSNRVQVWDAATEATARYI